MGRRLSGIAQRRADARPYEKGGELIAYFVATLLGAAGLIAMIAFIIPASPFARWVAPWLMMMLGGGALAWMDTEPGGLRHMRAAVGPITGIIAIGVTFAYLLGAGAGLVNVLVTRTIAITVLVYAIVGMRALPRSKRCDTVLVTALLLDVTALAMLGVVHA